MRVAIRTDASQKIGTGHVMRCLALAAELKAHGAEVEFILRDHPGHLAQQIQDRGFKTTLLPIEDNGNDSAQSEYDRWLGVPWETDARETSDTLASNPPDWLVVDHYGLDERWERQLATQCRAIFVIDDLIERKHHCDLFLDQNLQESGAGSRSTTVNSEAELLIGPRFAMLSTAFREMRGKGIKRREGVGDRLVLFFGGSDPTNETGKALQALESFPAGSFKADVVAGGLNQNIPELKSRCESLGYSLHVGGANMASLYANADLALGAPGTSSWERACAGIPSLIVAIAENQERIGEALAEAGCAFYLGISREVKAQTYLDVLRALPHLSRELHGQSLRGMNLVDGLGAQRVALTMINWWLDLRPATEEDCETIYEWRNSEEVRRLSNSNAIIPLESHRRWYRERLNDPDSIQLIAAQGGRPIGVVRFVCDRATATISICLAPDQIGRRLGPAVLRSARKWLSKEYPEIEQIVADVIKGNHASEALFRGAGYKEFSTRNILKLDQ